MNISRICNFSITLSVRTSVCLLLAVLIAGCGNDDSSPRAVGGGDAPNAGNPDRPKSPNTDPPPLFELDVVAVDDDPTDVWITVKSTEREVWTMLDAEDTGAFQAALTIHLNAGDKKGVLESKTPPPIVGEFDVMGDMLRFRPAFPLIPGEKYTARFDPNLLSGFEENREQPLVTEYSVPKTAAAIPQVVSIFPSGNIVPANHLKFYILFSEPMQRDGIFEHFQLIDLATDEEVPRPFRHVELWSKDNKQLTLWFHPGRQKRGVNLNVEFGPILAADGKYRLVINGDWKSEKGIELGETVTKEIRAKEPDHRQPEPKTWFLSNPRAASKDFLTCDFHEPLDWALLHSELSVLDSAGKQVPGRVEFGYGELSWVFHPQQAWKPGKYRVAVGHLLEDLAGNSIERLFEVDVTDRPKKSVGKTMSLDFEIFAATPATP